jgi:hypothetical protein
VTSTDKKVTRVTTAAYASRIIGHKARKIVVTIIGGDTLILRLHGTRQSEYMSIKDCFERARCARLFAERTTKRAAKRRAK